MLSIPVSIISLIISDRVRLGDTVLRTRKTAASIASFILWSIRTVRVIGLISLWMQIEHSPQLGQKV
jgi:hypothetical protein